MVTKSTALTKWHVQSKQLHVCGCAVLGTVTSEVVFKLPVLEILKFASNLHVLLHII